MKSTLSELNVKLTRIIYDYLSNLDSRFSDQKQVFYYPVSDFDSISKHYQKLMKINFLKFPFAIVNRRDIQRDPISRVPDPDSKKFVSSKPSTNNSKKIIAIRPFKANYDLFIFDGINYEDELNLVQHTTIDRMESYIEDLIFLRDKSITNYFHSDLIDEEFPLTITWEDEISYSIVPDKNELENGKGEIFGLNIPMVIEAVLGKLEEQKEIMTIKANIESFNNDEIKENVNF